MFELMRSISIDASGGRAEGTALVEADHPMLADHFPGTPVLPGSLLVELAAQVAGPLAEETIKQQEGIERWAMLGMIREAKFLHPTRLPATLLITAETLRAEPSRVITRVTARVDEQEVLRAELWMMMLEASSEWAEAIAARSLRVARWRGQAS
jgi:3-hydroxyacyl-[acyl-carrier-protein] dehydratase